MISRFLSRYKVVLLYGLSLSLLLVLLRWLELRFVIYSHASGVYITGIALLFTALGTWVALQLTRPKERVVMVEKQVETGSASNEAYLASLGMSPREIEVLELMATGLSNQEIAARLFVSMNTIKTHSSRIFEKLEVSRRTQAVEKARRIGLIG